MNNLNSKSKIRSFFFFKVAYSDVLTIDDSLSTELLNDLYEPVESKEDMVKKERKRGRN